MTDVLGHRGPDDKGYQLLRHRDATLGLGHRRLSILDLSELGHQPMSTADNGYYIIHNGEVYNYREIRKQLEKATLEFSSNTDTEVILKSYIQWDTEAVNHFIGMFSFVIYDKMKERILIFRDRAGVKPLYLFWKDGLLLFASELKSFHEHPRFSRELDTDNLALFMQYGYIPAPHCIFKSCRKLLPGHYLEIDLRHQNVTEHEYWDIIDQYNKPKLDISEADAIDETERISKNAFNHRLVSDVPVGIFLSGGYDSTAVTALLQTDKSEKLKTFTIGFHENRFNEAPYAARVAKYLGTDHTEFYCTHRELIDILPRFCDIYDEPFGDISAIPTILVSELSRQRVSAVLSADGGDEIFGGYVKYFNLLRNSKIMRSMPPFVKATVKTLSANEITKCLLIYSGMNNVSLRIEKFLDQFEAKSLGEMLSYDSSYYNSSSLQQLLSYKFDKRKTFFDPDKEINGGAFSKLLAIDYKTYLADDILTKVDRATMSVGLESREPLLDHRIIEFVARLPESLKYRNGIKKYLIKKIVWRHVPKKLMERPKHGFSVPAPKWFRNDLKALLETWLNIDRVKRHGLFNWEIIAEMKTRYLNGRDVNFNKIWYLMIFEMWYEKWMK